MHRGKVMLWDDTFVRYHEPHIGRAAVAVLEAAGFEVVLPRGASAAAGRRSARAICAKSCVWAGTIWLCWRRHGAPAILFLEPSCWSMFAEDYRELKLPGAERVAPRCHLFEHFIEDLLCREPAALSFRRESAPVAIHAHCHAKSRLNPAFMEKLARRLPGRTAALLDTGCCGMAGAFGAMASKYELSRKVARRWPTRSTRSCRCGHRGVGHELPAADRASHAGPAETHGGAAG